MIKIINNTYQKYIYTLNEAKGVGRLEKNTMRKNIKKTERIMVKRDKTRHKTVRNEGKIG